MVDKTKVDFNLKSSNKVDALLPEVKAAANSALNACKTAGYIVAVTCTYRSPQDQMACYAIGRRGIKGEKPVTNAKAWQSYHQFRLALDIIVSLNGKPLWNPRTKEEKAAWVAVSEIFKKHGFSWAADWKTNVEYAHFQFGGEVSLAELRAHYGVAIGQVKA